MDILENLKNYDRYYKKHVLKRMVERNIDFESIDQVLQKGRVIKNYPDDEPCPSCLILGFDENEKPLHVVVSLDDKLKRTYLITVYRPDQRIWSENYDERQS